MNAVARPGSGDCPDCRGAGSSWPIEQNVNPGWEPGAAPRSSTATGRPNAPMTDTDGTRVTDPPLDQCKECLFVWDKGDGPWHASDCPARNDVSLTPWSYVSPGGQMRPCVSRMIADALRTLLDSARAATLVDSGRAAQ